MATDRNVVIRLRGEISDFSAKMAVAGKSVKDVGDKMTGAEKESKKLREGMTKLGNAGGAVGLAAAAGVAVAVKAFADFDKAMSGVAAATHASKREMEDLRALALKTGADTAFSAVEAADGIEQLSKAGVATADIMDGGLQGALDLAAAGTIEVGDAAETAATAMTQFGLAGNQVPHIADLLAAAAGKAQGEVSDMSYALKQSGLVANQMGLTLEETTGALASFASAGLLGSDAGTSFKTMLMRLLPQTKGAADAMEAIGFSAFDAQGNMKSLTEIAGNLHDGLEKMTTEQRQATLATIFGQDAIRAATILYEQGADGIQEWINKVNDQGYAAETAQIKMDNLAGDVEKLKGALSTLFIETGGAGNDFLRGATQNAESFVNMLAGLPKWATDGALALGSITAVLGGGLWFTAKVINGVADMRETFKSLGWEAEKTAKALDVAKAAAGVFAVYMAADFVNSMYTVDISMRRMNAGFEALRAGNNPEQFQQLSLGAKDLADTLERAAFSDLDLFVGTEKDQVKAMDEALASLADNDLAQAKDTFAGLVKIWNQQGHNIKDLLPLFPEYQLALEQAERGNWNTTVAARATNRALEDTGGPAGRGARSLDDVGRAAAEAAQDADDLTVAISDLQAKLEGRQQNREYEQSLDDLADRFKERKQLLNDIADAQREVANADTASERKSAQDRLDDLNDQLKDFKLTLDDSKQAGRDWNTALEEIALNALEAGNQLTGMDQVKYLNNARQDFIDLATKITGSKERAKELADELGLVHRQPVKPKVDPQGLDDAIEDTRRWNRMLENLDGKTVETFIRVTRMKNDTGEGGGTNQPPNRSGFRDGGYTGNYPVDDVAGVVHGREFVMDADLTSKYRGFFEAIHRSRRVPGYRDGGYVATQSTTTNYYSNGVGLSDNDVSRIASAFAQMRPLYGDVHVSGDGSFRRELEADRRRAALDGRRPVA